MAFTAQMVVGQLYPGVTQPPPPAPPRPISPQSVLLVSTDDPVNDSWNPDGQSHIQVTLRLPGQFVIDQGIAVDQIVNVTFEEVV